MAEIADMDFDVVAAAIRLLIALPVVTALAYFLIKYGLGRRVLATGGKRRMRVVEQIPLGPKSSVCLIEVGGCFILLAQSESGFAVLKEMDTLPEPLAQPEIEPIYLKEILGDLNKRIPAMNSVIGKLNPWRGRKNG